MVGRIHIVGVGEMPVAVVVGERVAVRVMAGVPVGVGARAAGRRIMMRSPQRVMSMTRLRHPISAVPARLEFPTLLMIFIPFDPSRYCVERHANYIENPVGIPSSLMTKLSHFQDTVIFEKIRNLHTFFK